jgi:Calcineurin-like phosphoesterase
VAAKTSADEAIDDLMRSAWIVESARAITYDRWSADDAKFAESASRSRRRASIVGDELASRGRKTDEDLAPAHANWIENLLGSRPADTVLGDLFLVRLGDWVEGHTTDFLSGGAEEFKALGDQERATVRLPDKLPSPPPFEPLRTPEAEPPGPVRFRFGILADMHIGSDRAAESVANAVADLNALGVELVIQLGDITDQGNQEEFQEASALLEKLEMPYITMLGNHDVFSRAENRLSGNEYYTPSFGREPEGALLEHKGFRFAVLDSAEFGASPFPPFNLVTGAFTEGQGGAVVRGALTAAQHAILADVAAPGGPPTFMFLHHPPQPFTSFPPVLFGLRDEDSGRLHATCDSGNVWGVFAGHTHRNARARMYGSVPVQEVAIPRDYPFGFAVVDVSDEGYAYRFLQLSDTALVEKMAPSATLIHRRYGRGKDDEIAFVWTREQT